MDSLNLCYSDTTLLLLTFTLSTITRYIHSIIITSYSSTLRYTLSTYFQDAQWLHCLTVSYLQRDQQLINELLQHPCRLFWYLELSICSLAIFFYKPKRTAPRVLSIWGICGQERSCDDLTGLVFDHCYRSRTREDEPHQCALGSNCNRE